MTPDAPAFPPEEAVRLARLARLGLGPGEAERLAADLGAITRSFSDLAAYADALDAAPDADAGPLRGDVAAACDVATVDAILRAAPRVDAATRAVRAPRGPA